MVAALGNPNLESIEIDTVWNEWQDHWIGTPVETVTRGQAGITSNRVAARGRGVGGWRVNARDNVVTTTQQVQQTRSGIRTAIVPQVVRTALGDKVLNIAFIPLMVL
jgi:hypothetical protein